jgi:CheY-like chemotaxis protein
MVDMQITEQKTKAVTILLVDDDDVDAMGIERALKKLKIANPMIRARDGIEALALLQKPDCIELPYLILLDINMPRMNGFEFLDQIRKNPALSSSVVFVLTTSDDDEDKISAYQKHVAGYIVKKKVEDGFVPLIDMLDHYWRIVELPVRT